MSAPASRRGVLKGLAVGGIAAAGVALTGGKAVASPSSDRGPQPSGVDVTHAGADLVALVTATLRDKSAHDLDATMGHFSQRHLTYTDGTLGLQFLNWSQLRALFAELMPTWPASAVSYPTRILGDSTSGMALFTDTPELFGGEIRSISPVDISGGKIIRQVDYWDSRHFGVVAAAGLRVPSGQFPTDFGERAVGERAHPTIRRVSADLARALSAGDVAAATVLFTPDAAFEDLVLHTRFTGPLAIAAHLGKALPLLPYGQAATVRHVVGSAHGGGYEWQSQHGPVGGGVVALELDQRARVTRFTATWDGALLDDTALSALLATTTED